MKTIKSVLLKRLQRDPRDVPCPCVLCMFSDMLPCQEAGSVCQSNGSLILDFNKTVRSCVNFCCVNCLAQSIWVQASNGLGCNSSCLLFTCLFTCFV